MPKRQARLLQTRKTGKRRKEEKTFFTYFKKCNRTDGFTVLCISVLFKFEISCLSESFFKFNVNLVMFTTVNIYETILDKYYIHHILKTME